MGLVELVVLGVVGAVAALGAVAAVVGRDRRRRNRVVPGTETGAPLAWAGAHTPEARLHRRLRDAVRAARAVADPDGSLLAARVEIERSAVAVDEHLVALAAMPEREAASRMGEAAAAVAAIESAAAAIADIGGAGRNVIATAGPGRLPAVEEATARVDLLRQAIAELDEIDATVDRRPADSGWRGGVRAHPGEGAPLAEEPADEDEPEQGGTEATA